MAVVRFALSFVLITWPLTWLWLEGGEYKYLAFLREVGDYVYGLLGIEGVRIRSRVRYMNLIPFVALVLVTPRLGLLRRSVGLFVGLVILVLSHLAFSYMLYRSHRILYPPVLINISDALPLALWAVIARELVWETVKKVGSHVVVRSPDQQAGQGEGRQGVSE